MKIFSVPQITEADKFTIENEPISSISLMERASEAVFERILKEFNIDTEFYIFCGSGNNGGDGLIISRLMSLVGFKATTWYIKSNIKPSADNLFQLKNLEKCKKSNIKTITKSSEIDITEHSNLVIIDAIFGSGLNRKIDGELADIITKINSINCYKIAIDISSGLFADKPFEYNDIIFKANKTYTFEFPKLSFLFAESAIYCGQWEVLPIGIHQKYIQTTSTKNYYTTITEIAPLLKKRATFSHKGSYGSALLIAGKYGMMGAAVLASKSCIKSGVGLLNTHIPKCGYSILQTSIPEVIANIDESETHFSSIDWKFLQKFDAIAIGCGIGTDNETATGLKNVIQNCSCPLLIDADAINILSENKTWLSFLPKNSILTPHPKEFERIAGKASNSFEQLQLLREFCLKYSVYVVLKGAYTAICCPEGEIYFNSTGNTGMATAGSGDVLSGIILSLLAQGYSVKEAAQLSVYIHGLSADIAVENNQSFESLTASDIIDNLGLAFKAVSFL